MNYWCFTKDRVTAFTKTVVAFLILWAVFTWWGKMIYPHANQQTLLETAACLLAFTLVYGFATIWYPYRSDLRGAVHYWWANYKRNKTNHYEEESSNNEVLNNIQETREILHNTQTY